MTGDVGACTGLYRGVSPKIGVWNSATEFLETANKVGKDK
jgi:hypothetical protein